MKSADRGGLLHTLVAAFITLAIGLGLSVTLGSFVLGFLATAAVGLCLVLVSRFLLSRAGQPERQGLFTARQQWVFWSALVTAIVAGMIVALLVTAGGDDGKGQQAATTTPPDQQRIPTVPKVETGELASGESHSESKSAEAGGSSSPLVPIAIVVVVLAAISIGVVVYRQRKSGRDRDLADRDPTGFT